MRLRVQLVVSFVLFFILIITAFLASSSVEIGGLFGLLILCDLAWCIYLVLKINKNEIMELDGKFDLFLTENNIQENKRLSFGSKKYVFSFDKNILVVANISSADYKLDIKTVRLGGMSGVELLQDSAVIQTGGFGGAVVGGLVGGVTGAIVGSNLRNNENQCSMLAVRILFSDKMNPVEIVYIVSSPIDKTGKDYINAFSVSQELYATLMAMLEEKQRTT